MTNTTDYNLDPVWALCLKREGSLYTYLEIVSNILGTGPIDEIGPDGKRVSRLKIIDYAARPEYATARAVKLVGMILHYNIDKQGANVKLPTSYLAALELFKLSVPHDPKTLTDDDALRLMGIEPWSRGGLKISEYILHSQFPQKDDHQHQNNNKRGRQAEVSHGA